jgi:hypothetical protein
MVFNFSNKYIFNSKLVQRVTFPSCERDRSSFSRPKLKLASILKMQKFYELKSHLFRYLKFSNEQKTFIFQQSIVNVHNFKYFNYPLSFIATNVGVAFLGVLV